MQDIFTTRGTSRAHFSPGVVKADALGRLSMDLGITQPASDFCQKTAVYIRSQRAPRLKAGRRERRLFARLTTQDALTLELANAPSPN